MNILAELLKQNEDNWEVFGGSTGTMTVTTAVHGVCRKFYLEEWEAKVRPGCMCFEKRDESDDTVMFFNPNIVMVEYLSKENKV